MGAVKRWWLGSQRFSSSLQLKIREVHHPAEGKDVRVPQAQPVAQVDAQASQRFEDHRRLVGDEQQQVARLRLHPLQEPGGPRGRQELGEGGAMLSQASHREVGQPPGAELLATNCVSSSISLRL